MSEFRHNFRIYYEDTDAGGIVYYANYLKFAERGRTETLRQLDFSNEDIREKQGLLIVVRKVDINYISSARLDDDLSVITEITEVKGSSFWMRQTMETEHGVCAIARVLLVCVDEQEGKPKRIPEHLRDALENNKMLLH